MAHENTHATLETPSDNDAFAVAGLAKHYRLGKHRIPVLNDVTLTISAGEWVALVGPSGSGKTTLLHLLGALDSPSKGKISCLGQSYEKLSARHRALLRRKTIGLLFQNYHLFPELSAVENALLPALHWGQHRAGYANRAKSLLAEFGLAERLEHRPRELSGGEQQRVALVRALINNPDIILADEPTGNLDQEAAAHIMDILTSLQQGEGKTIVMVTHDLSIARQADRILQLRDGQVQEVEEHERP
ncbi:MAG: ABC transporter ATP-binding protein [Candidatus Pacebacteria bacterium]|nr:ABC transporter ATP-binding protein [Candidatus Paceibacterota bacterium]